MGFVVKKIVEIESSPTVDSEKSAKMEEIMKAVARTTKTPEVFAEAKRFRDIHEERAKNEY